MTDTSPEVERNGRVHFPHADIAKLVESQKGWEENKIYQVLLPESRLVFRRSRLSHQLPVLESFPWHFPLGGKGATAVSTDSLFWDLLLHGLHLPSCSTWLSPSRCSLMVLIRWFLFAFGSVELFLISAFATVCVFLTLLLQERRTRLCLCLTRFSSLHGYFQPCADTQHTQTNHNLRGESWRILRNKNKLSWGNRKLMCSNAIKRHCRILLNGRQCKFGLATS